MEIWIDFNLTLNVDDILSGEGIDPEIARTKRPVLVKTAEEALRLGLDKLEPSAAVSEVKVLEHRHERLRLASSTGVENGTLLTGPLVARHLAGADRVAAVVCTIGEGLETYAGWQKDAL